MAKKKPKKKTVAKHKPSTKRTLEEVLSSLQDLAKNELSSTELQTRAGAGDSTDTNQPEEIELKQKASEPELAGEYDFESGEPIEMDIPAPDTELASGQTGDIFDGLELLPEDQISNTTDADSQKPATNESEDAEAEIRWEDIPVLEDVAESPADEEVFQAPDPKLARKIAIQVAARLNIEMHKQGLDGLDIATINRLRALLVKELAKAAAKSENDDN